MKKMNFVVLGMLVLVGFLSSGCGSYIMSSGKDGFGNVRLVSGTRGLGSNAFYGTLTIDNNTPYPFYVYQGGYVISVASDKMTPVMIDSGSHFYIEDNGALIGGESTFTLVFRDKTNSRKIATISRSCQMRVNYGVVNNVWAAHMEGGQIHIDTSYSISSGLGGFYGY